MSDKDISYFDQKMTFITRAWPPALKSYYDACTREGFAAEQSMQLTIALMAGFMDKLFRQTTDSSDQTP